MKNRNAVSMIEAAAATVMVGVLMVVGMQTLTAMKRSQRAAERRGVATELIANLMEQATMMDPAALSEMTLAEREAAGLRLSDDQRETLSGAELDIQVDGPGALAPPNETPEIIASQQPPGSLGPPGLRRIAITLSWRTAEGEPSAPLRLVAWVAGREEAPP